MSIEAPYGIIPGSYYAFCDVCGYRYFGHTMKVNWKNQFVCDDCFEDRHPQDTLIVIKEDRKVPIARPSLDPPNTNISTFNPNTDNMYEET